MNSILKRENAYPSSPPPLDIQVRRRAPQRPLARNASCRLISRPLQPRQVTRMYDCVVNGREDARLGRIGVNGSQKKAI